MCDDDRARLRDLTSRLGFGNGVTEPQADNDTIIDWHEEQGNDAAEWRDSQLWRLDCAQAGHPDDQDCWEHDPSLRLLAAESRLGAVREWAYGMHGGTKRPVDVWPRLAAALSGFGPVDV